ncbi:hypothetical protein BDY19DRAFT_989931 [Irpex rosettiformis]|uniref:Uncharacterized protein n=1 Tax=Irpex rosettiformis TaxID=378272 RepID=A0ACB8UG71_9APHY|nr:hypothetical protein BDY19DRAFT_989931 [Irpex rosettiformis]
MPAITKKDATILVTGGNGYIATWIVGDLLEQGFNVRASVRTANKGDHLKNIYKDYGDKLQVWAVGDMATPGVWDKAVQDVEGIVHAAAAVHLDAKSPEEMIEPAVAGVLEILNSVEKYGNKVERFIYTSSCGTITAYSAVPKVFNETMWNDKAVEDCNELGPKALPNDMYCASKVLAEKELWAWYNKRKANLKWDLVTLHPPWVVGPTKHQVTTIESIHPTTLMWYWSTILGNFASTFPPFDNVDPRTAPSNAWIDVRDVAHAHTLGLIKPDAGNERIILAKEGFVWQDVLDVYNSINPSPWVSHKEPFPKGIPEGERHRNIIWDTSKEKRVLGMKMRTLEETARDILADYEAHGWK